MLHGINYTSTISCKLDYVVTTMAAGFFLQLIQHSEYRHPLVKPIWISYSHFLLYSMMQSLIICEPYIITCYLRQSNMSTRYYCVLWVIE